MSSGWPFSAQARAEFAQDHVQQLSPLVRRITAPNPGMMTGPGTNCYLVGREDIAVIDTGMDDPAHIERIARAGDGRIRWILVTHNHPDHSPGSRRLAELTGAPVLAFHGHLQGVRDRGFTTDAHLADGDYLIGSDFKLRSLHTPGHAADHLCFLLEEEGMLFAGDQVMEGTTVVIAPPDGDMTAYLASLRALLEEPIERIAPGHGRVMQTPAQVFQSVIAHRLAREDKILTALLSLHQAAIPDIVVKAYSDTPAFLHKLAEFSTYAHLRKLQAEGRVWPNEMDSMNALWRIIE